MATKKAFTKPHTIWNSVWPFHIGMKFFGYACFSVNGDITEGKIKCTFKDILCLFLTLSVTSGLIYLNYAFNLSLISTSSRVINTGSRFVLLFGITNVLISCLLMFFRRHKVWSIFTRCHKFDEEMEVLRLHLDHKGYLRKFIFVAIGGIVLLITMTFVSNYFLYLCMDPSISLYLIISYNTINSSMSISLLSTAFTLYAIYLRFNLINVAMKKFFVTEEEEDEVGGGGGGKRGEKASILLCKVFAKLADLHDSLVDIVSAFNHCFAFQVMNVVAGMFLTNIFSIFAIYRVYVKNDYGQYERALIQYCWNTYFLVYGLVIVSLASLVTRTGKYSAVLVHKTVNYIEDDDDPVIDCLKIFSQQMQHRAPVVSCGLFTFDFTLIFTIIGATATYIVILIQFDTDLPISGKNVTLPFNVTV